MPVTLLLRVVATPASAWLDAHSNLGGLDFLIMSSLFSRFLHDSLPYPQ